jgi:carbonic anhydrase/acetyltransferase-like protein (isoleucine patch superfamily)
MSVPSSLKVGPNTSLILVKKRYLIFYIFLIWISIFSIQFEFWLFWKLYFNNKFAQFYIFLPIGIFIMYLTSIIVSLIFAKILLLIVNLIHKPREGIFIRDRSDKDYRYWSLRNTIKKWPIWISHKFPFPFMNNICLMMFGVRTKYSNSLFEGWVDTEFIEFGKNVVVGQGAVIQSALIIGNLFIIKKTTIEDNVVIGSQSLVMPGTHIRKNSILGGHSMTTVGQELEENFIYLGAPAKKFKKNVFQEDGLEEIIKEQMKGEIESKENYEDFYTMRKDKKSKKG